MNNIVKHTRLNSRKIGITFVWPLRIEVMQCIKINKSPFQSSKAKTSWFGGLQQRACMMPNFCPSKVDVFSLCSPCTNGKSQDKFLAHPRRSDVNLLSLIDVVV